MNLETFKQMVSEAFPIGETETAVTTTEWANLYTAVNRSVLGTLRFQCLDWEGEEWRVCKLFDSGKVDLEGRGETLEQAQEDFSYRSKKRDRQWAEMQGYTGDFYF